MLKWSFSEVEFEAGCDEAGRGCLAGPVTAAAVILPKITKEILKTNEALNYLVQHLNDSKQINEKKRFELRPIIEQVALNFFVVHISHQIILIFIHFVVICITTTVRTKLFVFSAYNFIATF